MRLPAFVAALALRVLPSHAVVHPFVLKLNAAGSGLPGTADETGLGIALDADGSAIVVGTTTRAEIRHVARSLVAVHAIEAADFSQLPI
jgi:hypothetical protein